MEPICEFCGEIRSSVYCRADAARLCLSCDLEVHAANALSERHARSLLCEACNTEPAAIKCFNHTLFLCQNCDGNTHFSCSEEHKRQPLQCYTGCPSAAQLASLWGCSLDYNENQGSISGFGDEKGWNTSNSLAGFVENFGSFQESSPSLVALEPNSNVSTMLVPSENSFGGVGPVKVCVF